MSSSCRILALEKMLKAHVTEATQAIPAKSQDLIYLVKKAGLDVPQPFLDFIGKINTASIPTRYPDDLQRALKDYQEPVAREYLLQSSGGSSVAQTKAHVRRVIGRFCRQLEQMGIPTERVLLFGSQASGTAQEGSDIDLVIVSTAWERYSERERLGVVGRATAAHPGAGSGHVARPRKRSLRIDCRRFWSKYFGNKLHDVSHDRMITIPITS